MMKTSDLQQMQQQYRLITEDATKEASPIQQTADTFMDLHRDIYNAIDAMQQFMESQEFKFAVNNDWMGIDEDESEIIPSNFDDYAEIFFNY